MLYSCVKCNVVGDGSFLISVLLRFLQLFSILVIQPQTIQTDKNKCVLTDNHIYSGWGQVLLSQKFRICYYCDNPVCYDWVRVIRWWHLWWCDRGNSHCLLGRLREWKTTSLSHKSAYRELVKHIHHHTLQPVHFCNSPLPETDLDHKFKISYLSRQLFITDWTVEFSGHCLVSQHCILVYWNGCIMDIHSAVDYSCCKHWQICVKWHW